ncbi:MAG: hypothetical protein HYX97_03250 [Chloroflexi bacterium]|nr:hypothetical protein [Chloroflexota bacterium]
MYIKPDVIKIREGQEVSLKLVNEGREEHEFLIGRRVEMEGDKAVGYKPNDFGKVLATFSGQKAGLEFEDGIMEVEVEPGGRGLLTFTAPKGTKGEWEVACFEPGHYEAGMKGKLIVQ